MSTESTRAELQEHLDNLALVDHHVHSVTIDDLSRPAFESLITEAPEAPAAPADQFDSQIGFAIRRWCAPVLGLAPHADGTQYLERRSELGADEVNRRLLRSSGVGRHLVDTGFRAELLADNDRLAELAGSRVDEIVRIESIAESLVDTDVAGAGFADAFRHELSRRTRHAVGVKSIVAYRYGFDFDPERPSEEDVARAATAWLDADRPAGTARLDDPVLLRFVLWSAVDLGLPIQLHTGYGDPDLDLRRTDPLLLKGFLEGILHSRPTRPTPIVLLHSYPFHRHSGFLAQVYPHVFFDVGLAINYVGARAPEVVAESLELAPFRKILFSSDAWGPAELHALGALLWRRSTAKVLAEFVDDDEWSLADARRVGEMIGRTNAEQLYRLEGVS